VQAADLGRQLEQWGQGRARRVELE